MTMKTLSLTLWLGLVSLLLASRAPAQVGSPGQALRFGGGTQYAYINHPLIASNASFTVELWARRDRSNQMEHLASVGANETVNRFLRIGFLANNTFTFSFFNNDLTTVTTYTDTNWHHWACTYNAADGVRRIFRDGVVVAAGITPAGLVPGQAKFTLGWDTIGTNRFVGAMDEVRVWSTARTTNEILIARQSPLVGNEPGLAAYYRCDVFNGGSSPDGSTNNRSLNLGGVTAGPTGVSFVPGAVTGGATEITPTTAVLNGVVHPYGESASAFFEWGPNQGGNGTGSGVTNISGTNSVAISVRLTGLTPGMTYYYRVVAGNATGPNSGVERSFHAGGATLVVTNKSDNAPGSLRRVVADSVSGDFITFALDPGVNDLRLDSGEIVIGHDLTIRGPASPRLTLDGRQNSRIFHVTNGAVTLSDLRLFNGRGVGGGGVRNTGDLTLERCVIERCFSASSSDGGGLLNLGRLTLRDSTFVDNSTVGNGGGLAQGDGGMVFATNCTFAANTAKDGGAFASESGTSATAAAFGQCTFSGNTASGFGGALWNRSNAAPALLTLNFCTVATNTADDTGLRNLGSATLLNCLFAGNTPTNVVNGGVLTELGANLSSDGSFGSLRDVDPLLTPLGEYGGWTKTHALRFGSPAIALVASARPLTDQRGFPRGNGNVAAGAVEFHQTFTGRFGAGNTWNTYVIVQQPTTWGDAHDAAQRAVFHGVTGHLASVHSTAENNFLRRIAAGRSLWLGLTDNENFGGTEAGTNRTSGWVWTSGEPFTYQNFASGQPDDAGGADAVTVEADRSWHDFAMGRFGQFAATTYSVIEFETRAGSPVPEITPPLPFLATNLWPELTGRAGQFDVVEARNNGPVSDVRQASARLALRQGTLFHGVAPSLNHHDPDTATLPGHSPGPRQRFLSDTPGVNDDDVQALFKARIVVPPGQGGAWTFGVQSDDGFALRIVGQSWQSESGLGWVDPMDASVLTFPHPTGNSNTRGVIQLVPGEYDLEMVVFENGGSASWELYAARGTFTNDSDTATWQLVGAPDGLALTGPYGKGGALAFDGVNDTAIVPHAAALNAFPLTATAWFRTEQNTPEHTGLISKYAAGSGNGYQLHLHEGRVRAWYFRDPSQRVYVNPNGLDGGFVADGRWHHVAFVVDASGGRLYVDGQLRTEELWLNTPGAPTTTQPLNFGEYAGNFLNGALDEVTIWNRVLGEEEIRERMFRPADTNAFGLVGAWRFQEAFGPTARDGSTNRLHATLANGVTRVPSSVAETYPISSAADAGLGSLRETAAQVPGATLVLSSANPVSLTSGSLYFPEHLRLEGGVGTAGVRRAPGSGNSRVLEIPYGVHVQLSSLTITNGRDFAGAGVLCSGFLQAARCVFTGHENPYEDDFGGGIYVPVYGQLVLDECRISGNRASGADGLGGGLVCAGLGRLRGCTFTGNLAASGGAIHVGTATGDGLASLTLEGCTFAGNTATENGGALSVQVSFFSQYQVWASNCTFSGNAAVAGGGIYANARLALFHCTITDNAVLTDGGGIKTAGGAPALGHCIVAGNRFTVGGAAPDVTGALDSRGWNLVQNPGTSAINNIVTGNLYGLDPQLGPLADNGGPTLTHALLPGSPARDAGDPAWLAGPTAIDQRGLHRVSGPRIDLGAYEFAFPVVLRVALVNGQYQIDFTATPNASHRIFATTNVALPRAAWSDLGLATEIAPGEYRFTVASGGAAAKFFAVAR